MDEHSRDGNRAGARAREAGGAPQGAAGSRFARPGWRRQIAWFVAAGAVVLGSGFLHALFAQRDLAGVEIKAEPVAGNVHVLVGAGGNIGVSAGDDGLLMVDDQFAPLAGKIRAALKQLGKGDLAFVINTHFHGDHTGGNPEFGREATIFAHENVRKRVSTRQEFSRGVTEPLPEEGWPVVTYRESVTLHFNGEPVEVIHFPAGHTDGDSVIFFTKSNVVHMGDHLFAGTFPFVDLEGGGSVEGLIRNIEAVIARLPEGTRVIPGHGPVGTVADLEAYRDMLVQTTAIVRDRMKQGKSLDEIKAEGLGEKWKSWSWRFISEERWIETIHRSFS